MNPKNGYLADRGLIPLSDQEFAKMTSQATGLANLSM
jgi:hypothetical protein